MDNFLSSGNQNFVTVGKKSYPPQHSALNRFSTDNFIQKFGKKYQAKIGEIYDH
jgi:hypothetical protein